MKVIGWSGFENAMAFKMSEFPGLHLRDSRIVQGQDAEEGEALAQAVPRWEYRTETWTGEDVVTTLRVASSMTGSAGATEAPH